MSLGSVDLWAAQSESSEQAEAWVAEQGADFSKAYYHFLSAFSGNLDFQPAREAFSEVVATTRSKETELHARYFLALCYFSSQEFSKAHSEALRTHSLVTKTRTHDATLRVAETIITSAQSGMLNGIDSLTDIIADNSYMGIVPPHSREQARWDIATAFNVLDVVMLMDKMEEAAVYNVARTKLAQLETEKIAEDQQQVFSLAKTSLSTFEPCPRQEFYAMVGLLAAETLTIPARLPLIEQVVGIAVCAHNLKQIGLAFHLYLLDHDGAYPPLVKIDGTDAENRKTWIGSLMPYLGLERRTGHVSGWDRKRTLEFMPKTSLFLCPKRKHHWTTRATVGSEYGYIDSPGFHPREFDQTIPEKQVLVVESRSGYAFQTNDQVVCPHDGLALFLYADGHIEAHPEDWATNHDWHAKAAHDNPWKTK